MGCPEQVITLLPHHLVRTHSRNRRSGRVHEGDRELVIDLHDRGRDDIEIGLQLTQTGLELLEGADVGHPHQGIGILSVYPAGHGTVIANGGAIPVYRLGQSLALDATGLVGRTLPGSAEMEIADLLAGQLTDNIVFCPAKRLKKGIIGPGNEMFTVDGEAGLIEKLKTCRVLLLLTQCCVCHFSLRAMMMNS